MPQSVILVEGPSDAIIFDRLKPLTDRRLTILDVVVEPYNNNVDRLEERVNTHRQAGVPFHIVADEDFLTNGFDASRYTTSQFTILPDGLESCFPSWLLARALNELVGHEVIDAARVIQLKRNGPVYSEISRTIERIDGVRMPSKVELSSKISELSLKAGFVPESIGGVLLTARNDAIEVANPITTGTETDQIYARVDSATLLIRQTLVDFEVHGKVASYYQGGIAILDLDRLQITRIGDDGNNFEPVWNHDGRRLACVRYSGRKGIRILGADRSSDEGILSPYNAEECDVCWSNHGRRLAFTSIRNGVPRICISDMVGQNRRFHQTVRGRYPSFRRGDNLIAFCNLDDGSRLYSLDLQSDRAERICDMADCYFPRWSPDGTTLAFMSTFRDAEYGTLRELFVMDYPDGNVTRLTYAYSDQNVTPIPSWSSDSRLIMYNTRRPFDTRLNLWVAKADASECAQLSDGGDFQQPNWLSP